jgi:thiamine pyrophosphokinase
MQAEHSRRAVIVTGGEVDRDDLEQVRSREDFVIGVDGGITVLLEANLLPHLAVGDFDSAGQEMYERLLRMGIPTKKLPPEKDVTDTHFAVTEALKRRPGKILLLGAIGTRLDHTLANLFLLEEIERCGVRGEICNRNNRIRLLRGGDSCRVRKSRFRYLSLLPLTATVSGVTLTGFRYPLNDAVLRRNDSLGVSNELIAEEGEVTLRSGMLFVVESRD